MGWWAVRLRGSVFSTRDPTGPPGAQKNKNHSQNQENQSLKQYETLFRTFLAVFTDIYTSAHTNIPSIASQKQVQKSQKLI